MPIGLPSRYSLCHDSPKLSCQRGADSLWTLVTAQPNGGGFVAGHLAFFVATSGVVHVRGYHPLANSSRDATMYDEKVFPDGHENDDDLQYVV